MKEQLKKFALWGFFNVVPCCSDRFFPVPSPRRVPRLRPGRAVCRGRAGAEARRLPPAAGRVPRGLRGAGLHLVRHRRGQRSLVLLPRGQSLRLLPGRQHRADGQRLEVSTRGSFPAAVRRCAAAAATPGAARRRPSPSRFATASRRGGRWTCFPARKPRRAGVLRSHHGAGEETRCWHGVGLRLGSCVPGDREVSLLQ